MLPYYSRKSANKRRTAAYAYSDKNVRAIAYLSTRDHRYNLVNYEAIMYELRQEYESKRHAPPEEQPSELQHRLRVFWWDQADMLAAIWDSIGSV
jgi:hypothetical protein